MRTLSFITANYVGRALNYTGPAEWGPHDQATVKSMSADTFGAVCADIADAGFEALDIWVAHCHWRHHSAEDYLEVVKGICSQYDFTISSYAGSINGADLPDIEKAFRFVKQLGAPMMAGGCRGGEPAEVVPFVNDLCAKLGLKWAFENHPEKSVEEILARIDGGRHEHVGVALDTGWCATQGLDALEAAKRLRDKLFIVHLKDIIAPGGHETCAIGEGIVPCEKVVRYLVESGWNGAICLEHEPYDRDPMPEVLRGAQRVREWLE